MGISCFVVCCNEEKHMRRCLESVKWCDELIVIDSGSTDRTLEIAREYTDKILHRPWSGYVAQKSFGLEQCTQEWVLNIDADEEVSPELKTELQRLLENAPADIDGYLMNRVVFYLGRWFRKGGWYPEYRLRLCRRSATTWGGLDPHEKAVVRGKTARLCGELLHYTYRDIRDHVARLNSHSSAAAESLFAMGTTTSVSRILFNPPSRFFKFYLLKGGFREGVPGVIAGVLEGAYAFLKYAKLWEKHRTKAD